MFKPKKCQDCFMVSGAAVDVDLSISPSLANGRRMGQTVHTDQESACQTRVAKQEKNNYPGGSVQGNLERLRICGNFRY